MLQNYTQSVEKTVEQLVAIPSESFRDNSKIIALVQSWFKDYESTIQSWKRQDSVEGKNLVVKIPGKSSEKSLVFVCHLDTVPTSAAWKTDPFVLINSEDKLYGLGASDTKGGIASLIQAIHELQQAPAYDTYLIFDGDEEVWSTGAREFLKTCSIQNPYFVFIEPTNKEVSVGQRALLKFNIITQGVSTHSSQAKPERARKENAIVKMNTIINFLLQDAEQVAKEEDPILGITTQNLGMITGGTARNVFADSCVMQCERRLISQQDPEKELRRLTEEIIKMVPDVHIELDGIEPGFSTDPSLPFVEQIIQRLQNSYSEAKPTAFSAWSEAGLFKEVGPSIVLGPGNLPLCAHKANEYVEKKELQEYVLIYKDIIEQIRL